MNSNISIVTAFFDIGRGTWSGYLNGHPLPHYLKRTNEEYFQRFERMLQLDNDIVVFSESKFFDKFEEYKKRKPNLIVKYMDNWVQKYPDLYQRIMDIQAKPEFQSMVNQSWNPEYWNAKYVLVNFMKSYFVIEAIRSGVIDTKNMISWIDCGYCREDTYVPKSWEYNFHNNKIHLFTMHDFVTTNPDIKNIVANNHVMIQGCHIVASANGWYDLEAMMWENMIKLIEQGMIDDDQTLLLMSYASNPRKFMIQYNEGPDWFTIFKKWNFNHGNS